MVREPAVAGAFYPGDAGAVARELDRLVPARVPTPARAVIVPHAAWMYSGTVAGETYAAVVVPRLAVLLGPDHRGTGRAGAVAPAGAWRYPGGTVPIAADLASALLAATGDLREDAVAHRDEHALEVQVPFLHRREAALAIVAILLARPDPGLCRAVGEALGQLLAAWPEPVLVIDSTDLNHYESQAVSARKDRLAIEAILALDPDGLARAVRAHDISMCGLAPTLALLWAAPALGVRTARLVRYRTSGDVSGDQTAVVGYAGLVLQ
jgi:hypothetical protein